MSDISSYFFNSYKIDFEDIQPVYTKFKTNKNYILTYQNKKYFAKIYSSYKWFQKEMTALKILSGLENIPQICWLFDGQDVTESSIIMTFIDAENFNLAQKEDTVIKNCKQIGKILCKMHAVGNTYTDYGDLIMVNRKESWREFVTERLCKIEQNLTRCKEKCISDSFEYIYANLHRIPEKVTTSLLHNDLIEENILCDKQSGEVLAIIDFERTYLGHNEMDFAKLFWRVFRFDETLIESFYQGYGGDMLLDDYRERELIYTQIYALDMLSYLVNKEDVSPYDQSTIDNIFAVLNNLDRSGGLRVEKIY